MQKRNENHKGVSFSRVFFSEANKKKRKRKRNLNKIIKKNKEKSVQCNIDQERSKISKKKLQTKLVRTN